MAAGTITLTETHHTSVRCIEWQWTADAGGSVNGLFTLNNDWSGQAIEFVTAPGAGVSAYSVQVLDSNGLDVLAGAGAVRSTTQTQYVLQASLGAVATGPLQLVVTGAGAGKTGTAFLFIR